MKRMHDNRTTARLLVLVSSLILPFSYGAERVALVVGNFTYAQAPLDNPGNDASAMSRLFRDLGFQVIERQNLERRDFTAAIRELSSAVDDGGIALLFFAGHGLQVKGENFLMPVDADVTAEFDVPDECVSLDRVLSALDASESGLNIVFLDCCRNNPYKRGWRRSQEKGLAQTLAPEGTLISFAAAPGKEALDGTGKNSPFTEALLANLAKPGLPLTDALMAARRQVYDVTARQQRPWISHDLLEKVALMRGDQASPPTEAVAKLRAQIASMAKRVEELEAKGQKADALRAQLAALEAAQSDAPVSPISRGFTNSLGMRFVPVEGTDVLFCEHETRVKDYAAFAAENRGINMEWKDHGFKGYREIDMLLKDYRTKAQTGDHPVIMVSWEDAKAFCRWLSRKEGRTYRLPSDHEWSIAVGIGTQEDPDLSPKEKDEKIAVYPWGTAWPPPPGEGNFCGSESAKPPGFKLRDYSDQHPFTAPVKSYRAERNQLFDLSGNVMELCEDWYDSDETTRVVRGSSWEFLKGFHPGSSVRGKVYPRHRLDFIGFRMVAEAGGD